MGQLNDDIMGLVYINESFSNSTVSSLDTVTNGDINLFYVTFDTNLQDFDVENRNHRYYDKDNIAECLRSDKIQNLLRTGGWFGEFSHPTEVMDRDKFHPKRIREVPPKERAFKIMNPHFVGNVLKAKIQSAQGEVGEGFGKEVLAGWIPQFSARAFATMTNRRGKPYVIVKQLITYDAPWYPSHSIAHATSDPVATVKHINNGDHAGLPITESVDTPTDMINGVVVPLTEILKDVGTTDINAQIIMEAFDLDESALLGFGAGHKTVIIKDENNTIFANMNPESVKRVNDFYTSF